MKMTRRGMFGAAAGGIAAGPSVVRDVADQFANAPKVLDYGREVAAKQAMDREWTLQKLAQAKRMAAGDFTDEDLRDNITSLAMAPCPFHPLRSVSESAKHVMRVRRDNRRWRQNMVDRAKAALADYDKTGFLRHFI